MKGHIFGQSYSPYYWRISMAQKQKENIQNLVAYLQEESRPLALQEIGRKFPLISQRTLQRLLTQLRDQGEVKF